MEGATETPVLRSSGTVFGHHSASLRPEIQASQSLTYFVVRGCYPRRDFRRAREALERQQPAFAFRSRVLRFELCRLCYVSRVVRNFRSFGFLPRACCKLQIQHHPPLGGGYVYYLQLLQLWNFSSLSSAFLQQVTKGWSVAACASSRGCGLIQSIFQQPVARSGGSKSRRIRSRQRGKQPLKLARTATIASVVTAPFQGFGGCGHYSSEFRDSWPDQHRSCPSTQFGTGLEAGLVSVGPPPSCCKHALIVLPPWTEPRSGLGARP
jgi:hypothetical protein